MFFLCPSINLLAEGTKQLSPTQDDVVLLHTNATTFGNFAAFNGPEVSRLLVRIDDFTSEILYIGLSAEADDNGNLPITPPTAGSYQFRIVAPNGTVVHGPFTINVGNSNTPTWALASTGPGVLFPGGYSTSQAYATFNPATAVGAMQNGDYRIEFMDIPPSIVNIKWFDFTVAKAGQEEQGRLWSYNWVLRTPPIAVIPPECGWDRPFNGVFYTYTEDGFVSKVDFDSSGFQGLTFIVAFGDSGPGNTGNVIEDRKSINMGSAGQIGEAADHMVFLNEPDEDIFITPPDLCGFVDFLDLTCDTNGYCLLIGVTKPGLIEVIIDFFGDNGEFDPGTTDVLLVELLQEADTICLYWDGLKGDGSMLEFDEPVPTQVRYSQGIQHYSAYDVELLYDGFCTQTIRPICSGMSNLLYWDDSNITDNPATPFVDESDPGTGQPLVQLNGCVCQVNGCRTWDNYQLGSNPLTCEGEPAGYGNERILNTWWFGASTIIGPFNLPIVRVMIVGDALVCSGESSSFTANTNPDSLAYTYTWSGPGGFSGNTQTIGPVSAPGTYYVTVYDPDSNCSAEDSIEFIVSPAIVTNIEFMCVAMNAPNANVNLTVSGGILPYTFIWSNGATTEDLMNVPPGTYMVTVTDANNCTATDMITVEGCCSLDVTCPPTNGGTFTCVTAVPAPNNSLIIINDYCISVMITSMDINNGGTGCTGSPLIITRTYQISDGAGNQASCTQMFTVIDNVVPVIQCPANLTVQCNANTTPAATGTATATDNCDANPIITFTDVIVGGICPQESTITRTWRATDDCGNTSTCNQIITVDDSMAPTIACPPNITVQCTAVILPPATGTAMATDNCDGMPTITFTDVVIGGNCPQESTITRTWRATDDCGNFATCNQIIFIDDSTVPVISCPVNVTIQCNTSTAPASTGTATASDNCDATPTITFMDVSVGGACPQESTITRTWKATDDCGNSSTCIQLITIDDSMAPAISCPVNVTIQCNTSTLPASTGSATATDNCDGTPSITFMDVFAGGSCPQGGAITRTWRATDDCGNSSTCIQLISINDSMAPAITCPNNVTVQCNASTAPAATGTATATDNCDATLTITFTDVTVGGGCPQESTITRTWKAMDDCGNSSTCNQIITVDDSVAPAIVCPPNLTVACNSITSPAVTGTATASDNCDATPTITFTDVVVSGGCPQEFTITRTWRATDDCGNSTTCNQLITVDDNMAPIINCPANITVQCNASTAPAATGTATATDNCDVTPTITFADVTVGGICPQEFTITRTWRATDDCGNSSTCNQIITVDDSMAPSITCPINISIQCDESTAPSNTGIATATDNCDATPTITSTDVSVAGSCPQEQTITRTWRATDDCGNSSSCIQVITVQDTEPPMVILPPNVTLNCDENPQDTALTGSNLVINDNCSTVFNISFEDDNGGLTGCNGTGQIMRTWFVEDQCGNVTEATQLITLIDTTPPVAICQDITLNFDSVMVVTITPDTVDGGSFDNCGDVSLFLSMSTFDCIIFRDDPTQSFIMNVTDECGNQSTCEFNITGEGGSGILMECPSDIIIFLGDGECEKYISYPISAERRCGTEEPVLVQIDNSGYTSGDAFPVGVTEQEYVAYNSLGDTVYCSFTITVVGFVQTNNTMACNDLIQISLTQDCDARINPDMVLEGDNYGCYNDFFIEISNGVSGFYSVMIDETNIDPGNTYVVTITDNKTGISCWGQLLIEDKFPPVVNCMEVHIYCNSPLAPVFTASGPEALAYAPQFSDACSDNITHTYEDVRFETECGLDSIYRFWVFTDESGNVTLCTQRIIVIPTTLEDIVFPAHYQGECFGTTNPDLTGWPTLGGFNLIQDNLNCNLLVWYTDKEIIDCGGGQKIIRKWTAYDGCSGEHLVYSQIIKLTDQEPPVLTCPDDMQIGIDFWFCYANVSVPKPQVSDVCSEVVQYKLTSSGGTVISFGNNYVINELVLGTHIVTWTVIDECGNSATCNFTITVVDDVPPAVSCDLHTIVSLTMDGPQGITLVPADVFDDGSYDNCGPITFRARRMDSCIDFDWTTEGACIDHIPGGNPPVNSRDRGTVHRPCVPFACCDVGAGPIMVELEVTDGAGNINYCMVEVEVQDKISPSITCPPDIVVSCDFWFNAEEGTFEDEEGNNDGSLDEDPLSAVFGNVYDGFWFDPSARKNIVINDPDNKEYFPQPYNWGVEGWAEDNCDLALQVRVRIISDCSGAGLPANAPAGAIKLIERRFSAFDGNEGVAPGTCTQRIWVVDYEPFYITDVTCNNADPNDGVIWPCNIELHSCPSGDFSPEALNSQPTLIDDNCSTAAFTYEDLVFQFTDSACFKILRTWSVIDWSQYDPTIGTGYWEYLQVIKVIDSEQPVFTDCPQSPPSFCVSDINVGLPTNNQVFLGEEDPNSTSCSVHIRMERTVAEMCSDRVTYDVKVYLFNGDEYLQVVNQTELTLQQDSVTLVFDTRTSALPQIRLEGLPYNSVNCNEDYYHRILWTVVDGCGNIATCEYLFRLEDCKEPSPVCINGLSTVVMPANGEITIWASDFNASSFDDCTPAENLLYSFSGLTYEPSITFNCNSLLENGGPLFQVDIWVADAGFDKNCNGSVEWTERNRDFCMTTLLINDNLNVCDGDSAGIIGSIITEDSLTVKDVEISLVSTTEIYPDIITDTTGYYYFLSLPMHHDYVVYPRRNDHHKNGVTTLDLISIQRHLLKIELLDSPFKLIASDANNSESVSAIDIYEIRKLILGLYDEFPHSNSWRFVPTAYEFVDPFSPWPFVESLELKKLDGMAMNSDFIGIKIGDVNNSVKANLQPILVRGSRPEVKLEILDFNVIAGEPIRVPVYIQEDELSGIQFTLNTGELDLINIEPGVLSLGTENFAVFENAFTLSWNDAMPQSIPDGSPAFTLVFSSQSSTKLSDHLSLTSSITASEAYVSEEGKIIEMDVVLSILPPVTPNQSQYGEFVLYQNTPNPWTESTSIGFSVPQPMHMTLTVYEVTGKLFLVREMEAPSGYSEFILTSKELPAEPILYYKVDARILTGSSAEGQSASYSATKKMIKLK